MGDHRNNAPTAAIGARAQEAIIGECSSLVADTARTCSRTAGDDRPLLSRRPRSQHRPRINLAVALPIALGYYRGGIHLSDGFTH
jgi:hypothetical protein